MLRRDMVPFYSGIDTYVNTAGEPQFLAQLDRWSIGGDMDASLFKAGVPDSAKKVPFAK